MMKVIREERFRTPIEQERALGLWVDRIGCDRQVTVHAEHFRQLGQFAVVAVEKGTGQIAVPNRTPFQVNTGDVILITPDTPIRYGPLPRWDTSWIVWNGPESILLHRMGYLDETVPVIHGGTGIVLQAWKRLDSLMSGQDRNSLLERKITILDLIRGLNAMRAAAQASDAQAAVEASIREWFRDPTRQETITELARRARISTTHFRRLFKASTGTTPKSYQTAQRINRAKQLLCSGRSIKGTSETLGFNDVFYFMRLFKQYTGQTASRYVAGHRMMRDPRVHKND